MIPSLFRRSTPTCWLILLLVILIGAIALRLLSGLSFGWPGGDLADALLRLLTGMKSGQADSSVLDLRLLRAAVACLVGLSLATSGVSLQSLLRNPLAEPFILGISSGAAVGVMAQWVISHHWRLSAGSGQLGALLGACTTAALVFAAGRRRGIIDPLGLLLTGVVLSMINGSLIMLLNFAPGPAGMREDLSRWMMGYLNENVGWSTLLTSSGIILTGIALLWSHHRAMDAACFSDLEASSLGVNLRRLRFIQFFIASLLAATAVVLAGPISFVGLICPHLARLMFGPAHRHLLPAAAMLGATLILLADSLAVTLDGLGRMGLMPVGIFTAMLGGPMFLWMLRPRLGRDTW